MNAFVTGATGWIRSVRFAPTVHGEGDTGFTATLFATARAKQP